MTDALRIAKREPAPFVCPECGFRSWNRADAERGYCVRCKTFPDQRPDAVNAFRDVSRPVRPCDRCVRPYRGPGVYCCLARALIDAADPAGG